MNYKKISIGLLFLILALVVVPGASAYASFKETGNHTHPTTATQAAACKACHVEKDLPLDLQTCSRCHVDPYPPTAVPAVTVTSVITASPAVTTVAATETPTTPGFGIVAIMIGLFALSLLIKRTNK